MENINQKCVVTAHNLTKTYDKFNAVDSLEMSVRGGDIYGFVGKNGAGKSTTMKMICGLIAPTSGKLDVLGKDPFRNNSRTGVGALIESPGILESLSALDNMMHKAVSLGIKNSKEESVRLLNLVGLGQTGAKHAKAFSLGMKQRLGIALALVGSPKLLLLDEPFNGLDPAVTHEMRETLQKLNHDEGITIIVSSHVLDQLNRFATRFGVINEGKMVLEFESDRMAEMSASQIRVQCTEMKKAKKALVKALGEEKVAKANDEAILVTGKDLNTKDVSDILYAEKLQITELFQTKRDVEEFFLDLMNEKTR